MLLKMNNSSEEVKENGIFKSASKNVFGFALEKFRDNPNYPNEHVGSIDPVCFCF